jgi:hypothetical protein
MISKLAADLIVVLHFSFILFVIFGGLLVLRWHKLIWLHLPAAFWGALIEFSGWICPLTPLEIRLRQMAGQEGYNRSFTEEYLLPIIYPAELTRELQIAIGIGVILINLVIYGILIFQRKK